MTDFIHFGEDVLSKVIWDAFEVFDMEFNPWLSLFFPILKLWVAASTIFGVILFLLFQFVEISFK